MTMTALRWTGAGPYLRCFMKTRARSNGLLELGAAPMLPLRLQVHHGSAGCAPAAQSMQASLADEHQEATFLPALQRPPCQLAS